MKKLKIHFEQVPVEAVKKKIAACEIEGDDAQNADRATPAQKAEPYTPPVLRKSERAR
jgi:hypothetical protein